MNYGTELRLTGPFASAYLTISSFYKGNEFENSIPYLTFPTQITTLQYIYVNTAIRNFKILERVTNQIIRMYRLIKCEPEKNKKILKMRFFYVPTFIISKGKGYPITCQKGGRIIA